MLRDDIEAIEKTGRSRFRWMIVLWVVLSIEVTLLFGTLIHQMEPPSAVIAIPTDTPDPGIGL